MTEMYQTPSPISARHSAIRCTGTYRWLQRRNPRQFAGSTKSCEELDVHALHEAVASSPGATVIGAPPADEYDHRSSPRSWPRQPERGRPRILRHVSMRAEMLTDVEAGLQRGRRGVASGAQPG